MIPAPVPNYEPATINKRIVAKLIDGVVLAVLFPLVVFIFALAADGLNSLLKNRIDAAASGGIAVFMTILAFLLVLAGYEAFPLTRWGQTLGKKALKLHVLDKQGQRLPFWRSLVRSVGFWVMAVVSFVLIFATLSVLGWVILGALRKYQRLPHEWLSGSYTLQEFKGQPVLFQAQAGALQPPAGDLQRPVIPATPFADLERLRADGMISEEQYQAKRQELHIK